MKFLFMTDTHIKPENPKSRKDDYPEALKRKFLEISEIVHEEKVDYVLHGGDLFDRPDVPIQIVSDFMQIMQSFDVPIYMVAGNHDIYAQNPDTVEKTYLGLLDSLNVIHLIDSEHSFFFEENNLKVALIGTPYFFAVDKDPENYIIRNRPDADIVINIMHGLLLDKAFFEGIDYITIDQIKETQADITLCGHYHAGFPIQNFDGKYIINPGSIARMSTAHFNAGRIPKVVLIDLKDGKINIEERPLKSAEEASLVFDTEKAKQAAYKTEVINHFKNLADNTVDFEHFDFYNILVEMSKSEDLGDEVVKEAIGRIGKIQEQRLKK